LKKLFCQKQYQMLTEGAKNEKKDDKTRKKD